jgi:phosphate transport system permease protein
MTQKQVFTGRTRARRPKRSVLVTDRLARWVISLGGIGSIASVSMVGLFLLYVALPLFRSPRVPEIGAFAADEATSRVVASGVDEHRAMSWSLHRDGSIDLRRLDDGRILRRLAVPAAERLTCWSVDPSSGACALGYADGSVRLGTLDFQSSYLSRADVPAEIAELAPGALAALRGGMVQRTPEDQFLLLQLSLTMGDSLPVSAAPITLIDRSAGSRGMVIAALDAAGVLHVSEVREQTNLLTGEVKTTTQGGELDLAAGNLLPESGVKPAYLLLSGLGDNVMLAWSDGRLLRLDTAETTRPMLAEELDLVPEPGRRLTAMTFLLGKSSLVCGDDLGRVRVWFRIRDAEPGRVDGSSLVLAHTLGQRDGAAAVACLTASQRSRLVAAGFADGTVSLLHVTSDRLLAHVAAGDGEPVESVVISPREDFMMALTGDRATQWAVEAPHPEINGRALLSKIWYEGYDAPAYVWQSSSGSDSFEPKYSLVPLIFGTLKATVYSLLIGLPLAWFAAVYTSEFLAPRTKARIKPTIELMASLPSVVLGFLAALVFAPFLERWVPEALTAIVTVPVCFLAGAYLWQLASRDWTLRYGFLRLPLMALGLPVGVLLAWALGGWVERAFFAGDIMSWLDGQQGSATGGWIFILMAPSAALVFFLQTQVVDGWLRTNPRLTTRLSFALADLGRFALGLVATVGLAWFAGWVLAAAGVDPRGAVVDTYVQRNALVVGVVMGFAIIPIIYTISEDALSAVPDHLRAASLGAGATPWQTAFRVVIPPATSGLFSAMMIGLGRAVGETMIVLMAAGNTPIMEWNVFNGFRTLSANIAVELPEAVRNSTHYRTLFLAALTLFAITFVLNTAAEAVRMRFRKKSLEL